MPIQSGPSFSPPNITDWAASLTHQRRALISTQAFPGSLLFELDKFLERDETPTAPGLQRILEIMVLLDWGSHELAERQRLLRSGQLRLIETHKAL